jgi:hypothetical protein
MHYNVPTNHIKVVSLDCATNASDSDHQFEVEAIVAHRGGHPSNYEYKVRWKGYRR